MKKSIQFTEAEVKLLILILSVDLDALGLARKNQGPARSALKKLLRAITE